MNPSRTYTPSVGVQFIAINVVDGAKNSWLRVPSELPGQLRQSILSFPREGTSSLEGLYQPGKLGEGAPTLA